MQELRLFPRAVPRPRAAPADRHRHRGRRARLARAPAALCGARAAPRRCSGALRRSRPSSRPCSATCISREGGFTGPSAEAHRLWGTVTAVAARRRLVARAHAAAARVGAVRLAAGIAMLVLVSITGHYGGNLTHGTTFLGEYAPSFLRSLIGAAPRRPRRHERRRRGSVSRRRAAAARAALRHVPQRRQAQRRLQRRQLRLDARRRRHGPRRSCPATSKRASSSTASGLPPDDEAFMPAEGKTPLTAEQVEILRWWVGAGAPRDTTVGAIGAPGTSSRCSPRSSGSAAQRRRPPPAAGSATADPQLVADLFAAGLLVRQVSQSDARLVVSVELARHCAQRAALAALNAAAAPRSST